MIKQIDILRKQAEVFKEEMANKLENAKTESDVYEIHSTTLKEFYNKSFRPMTTTDSVKDINSSKMDDVTTKIVSDIDIIHDEIARVNAELSESYNANQDYRTGIKNKISYLGTIISDVNIMLEETQEDSIVFKDSLSNYSFVDSSFSNGVQATIATSEGIAFLSISSDNNLSNQIHKIKVNGNGEVGNLHNIKKISVGPELNNDFDVYAKFKSDENKYDDPISIIDNEPSTWMEYQKLGLIDDIKNTYRISWAEAEPIKDELLLRVDIELKREQSINWINITPYIPLKSKSNIRLYSVKVSTDGSNYSSVYKDMPIIDKEISIVPQSYSMENVFSNDSSGKAISQGALSFPDIKAKYIEVVLKQTKPYDELLGTYWYYKTLGNKNQVKEVMSESTVPSFVKEGPPGIYKITEGESIVKKLAVFEGWRYCIGLRGIDIQKRRFSNTSEIITKKFETPKPIKQILLYSNEIIPNEFLEKGLANRNEWIKYYISINDSDWHRISPMHHNNIGELGLSSSEESFKIYEINSTDSLEQRIASINKGYLTSNNPVTFIRMKIIFSRPSDLVYLTPILEEYALKCVIEGSIQ